MKLISYCNKVIEYSFYALFFLVPLVFSGDTSELFELNKMWLTFGITVIIGAAWATKMVIQKRIAIQRTPIDILLLLFLASQIISSIFTLDQHVSWWGYYSRFNGGLLSTICYILLYYAFVSNLELKHVLKVIFVSFISGLCVSLWGFPSHFGADPTCFLFRGSFDTSCWTSDFQPTVRAFSTLGQPEWLAAYMCFLLPIATVFALKNKTKINKIVMYIALTELFYLLLIFSNTRAGFIAFWIANILLWAAIYISKLYPKQYFLRMLIIINVIFLLSSFIFGSPIGSFSKYTLPELTQAATPAPPTATQTQAAPTPAPAPAASINITDSGAIRLLVWQGALRAWENNPLFGTGVETFAFAYYKYKLPAHNLTSEWDYLYNKAHNEYLNYLATTGIFGLGTYLGIIGIFFFASIKRMKTYLPEINTKAATDPHLANYLIVIALLAGYITMLITNFFGFSVVIINLYIFLTPAFLFILLGLLREDNTFLLPKEEAAEKISYINPYQWTFITLFVCVACWMIVSLIWYRQADIAYALGNNFDKINNFQQAYPLLTQAVQMEPNEPVYQDELSINLGALAAELYAQKDTNQAAQVAQNAITLSNQVVQNHPNNVVYWKDRVRLFYTLSASDTANAETYLKVAIQAIDTAKQLAPTDAKIAYNQGVLYGQAGAVPQAVQMLNDTIKLKHDYTDAYIALGLFYHELAMDKNGKVVNSAMQQKAIDTYTYILNQLSPGNSEVKKSLEEWRTSQ